MRTFTEPLKELQGYEELEQTVKKTEGVIQVSGCIDAVKSHIAYKNIAFLIKMQCIIRQKTFCFISRISEEMF